jgi:magnesium-transporting ATPase (P-type)
MKNKSLQFLSLVISALVLLYLLFVNIKRGAFVFNDWVVVTIDLLAKMVIDIILFLREE